MSDNPKVKKSKTTLSSNDSEASSSSKKPAVTYKLWGKDIDADLTQEKVEALIKATAKNVSERYGKRFEGFVEKQVETYTPQRNALDQNDRDNMGEWITNFFQECPIHAKAEGYDTWIASQASWGSDKDSNDRTALRYGAGPSEAKIALTKTNLINATANMTVVWDKMKIPVDQLNWKFALALFKDNVMECIRSHASQKLTHSPLYLLQFKTDEDIGKFIVGKFAALNAARDAPDSTEEEVAKKIALYNLAYLPNYKALKNRSRGWKLRPNGQQSCVLSEKDDNFRNRLGGLIGFLNNFKFTTSDGSSGSLKIKMASGEGWQKELAKNVSNQISDYNAMVQAELYNNTSAKKQTKSGKVKKVEAPVF